MFGDERLQVSDNKHPPAIVVVNLYAVFWIRIPASQQAF